MLLFLDFQIITDLFGLCKMADGPAGLHGVKQVTGIHFSEYVRNVRLGEACRLLLGTDMTNEEICHACGFRDITSFYRSFQTHMSMTPLAYRRSSPNK
jgi:AraC-like DNA-binding protein